MSIESLPSSAMGFTNLISRNKDVLWPLKVCDLFNGALKRRVYSLHWESPHHSVVEGSLEGSQFQFICLNGQCKTSTNSNSNSKKASPKKEGNQWATFFKINRTIFFYSIVFKYFSTYVFQSKVTNPSVTYMFYLLQM